MMRRSVALAFLLYVPVAFAQLRVQEPPTRTCAPGATPILGIALESYLDGTYSIDATDALEQALRTAGYHVVPDYDHEVLDKASIAIHGRVEKWRNLSGEYASRVGAVSLSIEDLSTGDTLLTLTQDNARLVFNAPRLNDFVNSVVGEIAARYCQASKTR